MIHAIADKIGLALTFTVAKASQQPGLAEKQLKKEQSRRSLFTSQSKAGDSHSKLEPTQPPSATQAARFKAHNDKAAR